MKMKFAAALITLSTLSLHAQLRPTHHFALTAGQVTRTLAKTFAEHGIQLVETQVVLPANVVSTDPEPQLEIRSIEPLGHISSDQPGEVSSAVRLTCGHPATCVPFYAIVTLEKPAATATSLPIIFGKVIAVSPRSLPATYAVRAGAHTMLLMEDGGSHIRLSVIALENGAAGHTIKVSSLDHKQTYRAEVTSAGELKGSF